MWPVTSLPLSLPTYLPSHILCSAPFQVCFRYRPSFCCTMTVLRDGTSGMKEKQDVINFLENIGEKKEQTSGTQTEKSTRISRQNLILTPVLSCYPESVLAALEWKPCSLSQHVYTSRYAVVISLLIADIFSTPASTAVLRADISFTKPSLYLTLGEPSYPPHSNPSLFLRSSFSNLHSLLSFFFF